MSTINIIAILFILFPFAVFAQLQRPESNFKIYQFHADKIRTVDGKTDDWAMVPESFIVGTDQLVEDSKKYKAPIR